MGAGIRKPRAVIAAWLVVLVVLAGIGAGVEQHLTRSDLVVPGTASAHARELSTKHFGESNSLVVMLEGPRRALDRQGRALARRLQADPRIDVVGPWARGAGPELRPKAGTAVVLVRANVPYRETSEEIVPLVRREARRAAPPVRASVTGYA